MPELSPAVFRRWTHVREEDAGGNRVFRPAGQPLPPARGRDGLELRTDGTFVSWTPGPVDAPVASDPGTWSSDRPGELRLRDAGGRVTTFEIMLVTDDRLVLRPAT